MPDNQTTKLPVTIKFVFPYWRSKTWIEQELRASPQAQEIASLEIDRPRATLNFKDRGSATAFTLGLSPALAVLAVKQNGPDDA